MLAVAIQAGMTVFDLEEMELAYAPQYGSAKDPVNMAGFVAAGLLRGDHPQIGHGNGPGRDGDPVKRTANRCCWTFARRRNLRPGTFPGP